MKKVFKFHMMSFHLLSWIFCYFSKMRQFLVLCHGAVGHCSILIVDSLYITMDISIPLNFIYRAQITTTFTLKRSCFDDLGMMAAHVWIWLRNQETLNAHRAVTCYSSHPSHAMQRSVFGPPLNKCMENPTRV